MHYAEIQCRILVSSSTEEKQIAKTSSACQKTVGDQEGRTEEEGRTKEEGDQEEEEGGSKEKAECTRLGSGFLWQNGQGS